MTIELHTLKSAPGARKDRKRVGRGQGSGNGKTAGRGHKGQKSRSGYSSKAGFEGGQMPIHRRLPKRGFYHEQRHPLAEVNLDVLEERFADGDEITVDKLRSVGAVKIKRGGVKLLGRGEVTKRFKVQVQAASASAREKIEKAGGSLTLLKIEGENAAVQPAAADAPEAPVAEKTVEPEDNAPEADE
ncbi:MAG TPA: 50S ribosomal protein L15 [Candidatus Hydrogenedentes bacterium]|nr:50S ribosomal protein L15 [Candidatus Hydrogenedentota bacterium]